MNMFWSVFGLGLTFFASPGPINIETVRHGVRDGYRAALAVQIGATCAELVLAVAVLLGIAPFMQHSTVQFMLAMVGAAFLLWTAWRAVHEASPTTMLSPQRRTAHHSALMGAGYAISNPLGIFIWLTVAAMLTATGVTTPIRSTCW